MQYNSASGGSSGGNHNKGGVGWAGSCIPEDVLVVL